MAQTLLDPAIIPSEKCGCPEGFLLATLHRYIPAQAGWQFRVETGTATCTAYGFPLFGIWGVRAGLVCEAMNPKNPNPPHLMPEHIPNVQIYGFKVGEYFLRGDFVLKHPRRHGSRLGLGLMVQDGPITVTLELKSYTMSTVPCIPTGVGEASATEWY